MTKQEAVYWKQFILKTIREMLPTVEPSAEDAVAISHFVENNMRLITGQQMLPQRIFRDFVELFGKIPAIQEQIVRAQEQISVWLECLPYECSVSDVYAMFDEFRSPFVLDDEGYIVVTNMAYVDDDGYYVIPAPAMDIDRYIEVVNI